MCEAETSPYEILDGLTGIELDAWRTVREQIGRLETLNDRLASTVRKQSAAITELVEGK